MLDPARHPDDPPGDYLSRLGVIFARFDQQDSGNLSYGLEVEGTRYFVKTAGRPDDEVPLLPHDERVSLLRNAVRLAAAYRHAALPRLHQTIESPHGPMLFYDWVDGDLVGVPRHRRGHPDSAFQRFRALPVGRILACLDTIVEVHDMFGQAGEVMGDFYDGCLLYNFVTHRLSLVDLDSYRPGSYRNTMGRMFGSARFMAPEEFTMGALIDQRTSVFTLGRTILILLSDGSTDPAAFRGQSELFKVAVRATDDEPDRRYGSLPEFCAAWRAVRSRSSGQSC